MTGAEFLQQLAEHLQCLQEEEHANAMAYYREYFEEAGQEHEAAAAERLGSPQSVAERIIKEVGVARPSEPQSDADTAQSAASRSHAAPAQYTAPPTAQSSNTPSVGRILFAVLILLLTSPFWIAVPIVWFSLIFVLVFVPLVFLFAGIFAPVQGILGIVSSGTANGLYDLGGGVLCIGLLMLTWKPCLWLSGKMVKLFGKLCAGVFCLLIGKERRV